MANTLFLLVVFFSSPLFLSAHVNGNELLKVGSNKTSSSAEVIKKSKRAIGLDSVNYSNQQDLYPHVSIGEAESNDIQSKEDSERSSEPMSIVKRAPSGFTGMRGKKQSEFTDLSPNDLDWSFDDDYYNDQRSKKAPSGFQGMRGKKMERLDYEKSLLEQLLRKLYQEDDEDIRLYLQNYDSPDAIWENDLNKRAPSGFLGMRGKRPLDFPFDGGKRGSNAFFGVRGKRDFKRSAVGEQFQPGFLGFRNKFVGVRGKKDSSAAALHRFESQLFGVPVSNYRSSPKFLIDSPMFSEFKRAPMGFLGMRGKRDTKKGAIKT